MEKKGKEGGRLWDKLLTCSFLQWRTLEKNGGKGGRQGREGVGKGSGQGRGGKEGGEEREGGEGCGKAEGQIIDF